MPIQPIGKFNPLQIERALFDLLKNSLVAQDFGFQLFSRNASQMDNLPLSSMPAFFLIPFGGTQNQPQAQGIATYIPEWVAVVVTQPSSDPDPVNPPQDILWNCWSVIDAALASTPPGEAVTLGGLVAHVWIDGVCPMQPGIGKTKTPTIEIPIRARLGIRR